MWTKLKSILEKEQLEYLLPLFHRQWIDDSILCRLTADDLRELGIRDPGVQKQLLVAFNPTGLMPSELVEVEGGTMPNASELLGTKVGTFQISKYAVTMEEWQFVRSWANANGFDIEVKSAGEAKHPVTQVNWYDCVKWCNAKSLMEGLEPVYGVIGEEVCLYRNEFDHNGSEKVLLLKPTPNGYRLPTEAEWEWAARGGVSSQGYTYSGSDDLNAVAWYASNADRGTKAVGKKKPNELGIYDMSGNVWEWCEDVVLAFYRRVRGGSWAYEGEYCAIASRADNYYDPVYRGRNIGFRLARNAP